MKTIDYGKIVVYKDLESDTLVFDHIINGNKKRLKVSEEDFIEILDTFKFDDAFYFNNSENFGIKMHKVINSQEIAVNQKCTIIFRNFDNIKNDNIIKGIKHKIYPILRKRAIKAANKMLLSGLKRLTIIAGGVAIIVGCTKLYKSGMFNGTDIDNSSSNDDSSMIDDNSVIDDSSIIDDSSVVDTNFAADINTVSSGVDSVIDHGVKVTESLESTPEEVEEIEEVDEETLIREKFYLYSSYYNFSDYLAELLYNEYIDELKNSNNLDSDIMSLLYDFYMDEVYDTVPRTTNTVDNETQCKAILKYAEMYGVTDTNLLYIMLAAHDFETGWGTSPLCVYSNNFGGNTCGSGFQYYPTYEIGAYDFVNDFMRIYKQTYSGNPYNIEYDMNPVYCTENVAGNTKSWAECVIEIKNILIEDNVLEQYLNSMDKEKVKVR